jgi:hypothetical protein
MERDRIMANHEMLICEAHVRDYILGKTPVLRPGWTCKRVSKEALEDINAQLKTKINNMIREHPTLGVTFKTRTTKRKKKEATP